MSNPVSNQTSGPGRWARRAKAAAQQSDPTAAEPAATRHRPDKLAEPTHAPGSKTNVFLPGEPPVADPDSTSDDSAAGDESLTGDAQPSGGLAALGLEHATGPTTPPVAPAPLNPALPVSGQWPAASTGHGPGPQGTAVQLVGLHGGAGTSTVAALIGPHALDCGTDLEHLAYLAVPVLFVTRSHAHGLDLALRLGQQFAARSLEPVPILGLCVVHDAPTLSKKLARTLRSVQKALPSCWTVPWDEDLRNDPTLPPTASRGRLGRDVRRIVKKAQALHDTHNPPSQVARTHNL